MILDCMIVDDEIMARKSLGRFCEKHDNLNVVQICENANDALSYLIEHSVDLIFLDIEMPELSGLEFLEQVVTLPQIIFTTSKTEYAYEAFEYSITDYLKKPINISRFQQAVEKALEEQQKNNAYRANAKEVYLKVEGKYVRVAYDEILYFENAGDYVKVKTTESSYIIYSTLKNIDAKLDNPQFLKVHRSFIVNLNKIKDIEEGTLVIEKKVITISRANKSILMNKLNIL